MTIEYTYLVDGEQHFGKWRGRELDALTAAEHRLSAHMDGDHWVYTAGE